MKRLDTYSQHFLRNPRLVHELVGHTNIRRGDTVYDIGAGSGIISSVLAKRCKQVVAIEYEPRTARTLKHNMERYENVTVVQDDILSLTFPANPYKIFANIPFHLSSQIVQKLTRTSHPPQAIYLIVQKQFARKLLVDTDAFTSALGISIAPWFTTRIRRPLRRTDFWPHPAVDTVLLEIKPRAEPLLPVEDMANFGQFVEQCFHDRQIYRQLFNSTDRPSSTPVGAWVTTFQSNKQR